MSVSEVLALGVAIGDLKSSVQALRDERDRLKSENEKLVSLARKCASEDYRGNKPWYIDEAKAILLEIDK